MFRRSQVRKFVLFLVGRVGSTYLTSVLSSHPHVLALGEELLEYENRGADAQLAQAKRLLSPPLVGRKAVRGFNVKLVHLCDRSRFAQLLREENCQVIHMLRRNRIKSVISRLNGERLHQKTGMWGLFDPSERPAPLEVDLSRFDEYLAHREKMDAELHAYVTALQLPTLTIHYEDLLQEEAAVLRDVFTYLRVPDMPVRGRTLKITGDNLRESLANFEEVKSRYVGTPYESMFDEVIVARQS